MTNPIRPTDNEARALAHDIINNAKYGALGVIDRTSGGPVVSRVATLWIDGAAHLLVSQLSLHTKAIAMNPTCSLLLGEPKGKGDPLTHPRITLQCRARQVDKASLRESWLAAHPKSKLYIDFTDFIVFRLDVEIAYLNGGFGKAFHLNVDDLKT